MEGYLILNNIGKRGNFGGLIRSAAAMNILDIFVVGAKKIRTFGNQGTLTQVNMYFWNDLTSLKTMLVRNNIEVVGIEIDSNAVPLHRMEWTRSSAFMLGNEWTGMSDAQRQICDRFVYIPQFSGATASLNVAVAGSIVFFSFALCASQAVEIRGQKFVVGDCSPRKLEFEPPKRERRRQVADVEMEIEGLFEGED